MGIVTLAGVISGIVSGGLTYIILQKIFKEVEDSEITLTKAQKRLLAYVGSFVVSYGALILGFYLGYMPITPDTVLTAFLSAYAASQAIQAKDLDKVKVPVPPVVELNPKT